MLFPASSWSTMPLQFSEPCVYVCVCTYVYLYMFTHTNTLPHTYVCVYISTYTNTHTHTHTRTRTRIVTPHWSPAPRQRTSYNRWANRWESRPSTVFETQGSANCRAYTPTLHTHTAPHPRHHLQRARDPPLPPAGCMDESCHNLCNCIWRVK